MSDFTLKPVCNQCNVPLIEDSRHSDEPLATCPVCGLHFGPMSEIEARLPDKQDEAFRDLWSWHAVPVTQHEHS